jgi:hypothetical protein
VNFAGKFIHIGDIDISHLKQQILQLSSEEWLADSKTKQQYEDYADTETIQLVWDADCRHIHPTKLPALAKFAKSIQPILARIAAYYESSEKWRALFEKNGNGYFIRAKIVKLKAGGEILEHQDKHFSLVHSHRVHVPITTNDNVHFEVADLTFNMLEGEMVEINNRLLHSVKNGGNTDRVHLILDWVVPGEQCCCSDKIHPSVPCNPQACMETDQLNVPCCCIEQ